MPIVRSGSYEEAELAQIEAAVEAIEEAGDVTEAARKAKLIREDDAGPDDA
jgi:hypothetical protein